MLAKVKPCYKCGGRVMIEWDNEMRDYLHVCINCSREQPVGQGNGNNNVHTTA